MIGINFLLIITSKNFLQWKLTTDSEHYKKNVKNSNIIYTNII